MWKRKIGVAINVVLLIWFVCIVLFWHLDLSKGTSDYYDTFAMAPYAIFHLVVFSVLMLLSIFLNRISLYHLLLLSLYFPFIQLANYPMMTIRDVYLHGGPTRTILENGTLAQVNNLWPESWPTSFNLQGIVSIVSGFGLVESNYVLYLCLMITFTFTLASLARTLKNKGYKLAWIGAMLFLPLFFNHFLDNFHHYSRTALAFTFLLFFLYNFIRFQNRYGLVLQLLTITVISSTNPFQSFALILFMSVFFVISRTTRFRNLAMFSLVVFFAWFLFQASSVFIEAISMLNTFFSPQYATPFVQTILGTTKVPWWAIFLRDLYKYSLFGLLFIASLSVIMILPRARSHSKVIVALSSLLFSFTLLMLVFPSLPEWGINRSISFVAFPAAFSSLILLEEVTKRGKLQKLRSLTPTIKKTILVLLLVFTISLSAAVMVLRFERNFYFGELTHPSELSSLSFFTTYNNNSTVTIVSWRTSIYFAYFNYNSSHKFSRLWYLEINELKGNLSKLLHAQTALINQSQSVIRGMRDSYTLGLQDTDITVSSFIDNKVILPNFNLIYSNKYYSVYERALPNN